MTTYIFNAENKCVSQSHNLRGLFDWARRAGGVTRIECHVFPFTPYEYEISKGKTIKGRRPDGYLIAHMNGGHRAETWFVDGGHLVDWARDRVKPRRNSWFSGASVDVINHAEWVDMGARK